MTMPALGQLLLPGLAVAIYTATGHEAFPIFVGVALGLGAFLVTTRIAVPPPTPRPASAVESGKGLLERFVEPSALAGTAILVASFSSWSIFTVFPSVYVQHVGAPVEVLVLYFPIFGLAQAISQPVFGRFADQLGRMRSITAGALMAIIGLLIVIVPPQVVAPMVTFSIGAFIYALSQSLVAPTISALVMERAPRHRLGSAMATYSSGYQLSTGIGSIVWGAIIATFGFTWLFLVAAGVQVLAIAIAQRVLRPGR
jgi:MFS family permease